MLVHASLLVCLLWAPAVRAGDDPKRQQRFDTLVAEAVRAREAGDLDRTAALLKQAIDIRPAPEMLNNLGTIYEDLGRYREAAEAYQKVLDDPQASEVLKRLDATRIELLTPKLDRAWVRLDSAADSILLFVDASPVSWSQGQEVGVQPGSRTLELVTGDGQSAQLVFLQGEAGRRAVVAVGLDSPSDALGQVTWEKASALQSLTVNGYAMAGDLSRLARLYLNPGRYVVEARQADRQVVRQALQVEAGASHSITEMLRSAPESELAAEGGGGPGLATWVTVGLGTALTVAGVGLLGKAALDRDEVKQATTGDEVTGMTQVRAHELEENANSLSMTGGVLTGIGVVAAGAGVVLLLTSEGAPEKGDGAVTVVPTVGGVVMRWTF